MSQILRHFPKFTKPTSGVHDSTETILAILYREVPHMLQAKYQPNRPSGSREEVV